MPPAVLIVENAGTAECNGSYTLQVSMTQGKVWYSKDWDASRQMGFRIVWMASKNMWGLGSSKAYYTAVAHGDVPLPSDLWSVAKPHARGPSPTTRTLHKEHPEDAEDIMSTMRSLMSDEELSDVRLELDDGSTIAANRTILAARSPYFRKLFFGAMREAQPANADEPVRLSGGLEAPVLRAMCEWAYTGNFRTYLAELLSQSECTEMTISECASPTSQRPMAGSVFSVSPPARAPAAAANTVAAEAAAAACGDAASSRSDDEAEKEAEALALQASVVVNGLAKLLQAAGQYQMERLQQLCELELNKRVSTDNVSSLLCLADAHAAVKLRTCCFDFIVAHRKKLGHDTLESLPKNLLVELIMKIPGGGYGAAFNHCYVSA